MSLEGGGGGFTELLEDSGQTEIIGFPTDIVNSDYLVPESRH